MFKITFHKPKRDRTLRELGLKFEDSALVFDGFTLDDEDLREDYGEERTITIGALGERVAVIVWTPAGRNTRRVISMRHADGYETDKYWRSLSEG